MILSPELARSLPPACDVEEDMLDLAFGLTATCVSGACAAAAGGARVARASLQRSLLPSLRPRSRLACQVKITESMEGAKVTLPSATRNFYVDGHVAKPH